MQPSVRPAGELLREWRLRRRLSQLDLACDAGISSRHLSFLETGRARPSREMVLRLAERLDVPLRARNTLLVAAGFAPIYPERPLSDPALSAARRAVDLVLAGHEPYPALAVDRHWTLVAANRAVQPLLAGIAPALLEPPVNVLRLTLHPDGLADRLANPHEWRAHLFHRLQRQVEVSGDAVLSNLLEELRGYPAPMTTERETKVDPEAFVVPFRLRTEAGTLSFFSTTTVFGTPADITLSELALETFFPADAETARIWRSLAEQPAD
ncbi:MAG TPA: helix-turn-helix transcriptional regulator [Vicinamibacterales bacterium]